MRLEFSGAPEIAAPPQRVWARLMDPSFVASCVPSVEKVEALDETHYRVVSAFGAGSIKLRFELDVELADIRPHRSARMLVRGKAPGSAVHVETSVELEPLDPKRTRLSWKALATVHGTAASVGARLLKGTAKKLTDGFWKRFAKRVR